MPAAHIRVNSHLQPYETPPLQLYKTSPLQPGKTSPLRPYKTSPLRPYEAHLRLRPVYATLPPLATLCGSRNKQTNKQTNMMCNFCDSHSSLLKTLLEKWAGKEYYRSLNLKLTSITIVPSPLWISCASPLSRPCLVCLPHSRSCVHRSSWLFVVCADLDCCDSKHWYALFELWSIPWW